jgi:Domain of unknown function (DUF4279)
MKINQYAHIVVGSDAFDPDQITVLLGLGPTSVRWRGSSSIHPMIPVTNLWKLRASGSGRVDDLIVELVETLESVREALTELMQNEQAWVSISVLRDFRDSEGVDEDLHPADVPAELVKLPGQHQLLGFHLDVALMSRLVALGCLVDADEYG